MPYSPSVPDQIYPVIHIEKLYRVTNTIGKPIFYAVVRFNQMNLALELTCFLERCDHAA